MYFSILTLARILCKLFFLHMPHELSGFEAYIIKRVPLSQMTALIYDFSPSVLIYHSDRC